MECIWMEISHKSEVDTNWDSESGADVVRGAGLSGGAFVQDYIQIAQESWIV